MSLSDLRQLLTEMSRQLELASGALPADPNDAVHNFTPQDRYELGSDLASIVSEIDALRARLFDLQRA